ncbi:MAG: FecR domain-containing protein, partial [Lachnospiraceae bacterium]|nr:FecR domain-containing protein [Lachnospiraceae bacterium]
MPKRESKGNNVSTDPKNNKKRIIIILLAAVAVVAAAIVTYSVFNKAIKANTMRLLRIVGTVELRADGQLKTIVDNMRLASGNVITTGEESLASISLDDSKIITIEEESEAEFYKNGKQLELNLTKGKLFFDVRKALDENESLDIKSSTMVVGIRGTSGYVWTNPETGEECIFIADGHVEVTSNEDTEGAEGASQSEPKKVEVKPGEILVTKVVEENGVKKVEMEVKPATIADIPPAVFHELATHQETFDRFIEESGFDRDEVLEVIEATKGETFVSGALIEIGSDGTVVEVPTEEVGAEGGKQEEEKKTLSIVIKEIAGKIFGGAEAKDGDPTLADAGDKAQPEVTLIPAKDLPSVVVTGAPSPGAESGKPGVTGQVKTQDDTKPAITPLPTLPPKTLIASADETQVQIPEGIQEPSPTPSKDPEPVPAADQEPDTSDSSDDSSSSSDEPDPEPQAVPTPTPAAMPCDISTSSTFIALSSSANVNLAVRTDSTVFGMNVDRSEDDLIFTSSSFGIKTDMYLYAGDSVISGPYYARSAGTIKVPVSALGSNENVSVKTGAYLPATISASATKDIIFGDEDVSFGIKSGSNITSMSLDRDDTNIYVSSDDFGTNVMVRAYMSETDVLEQSPASKRITIPISRVRGKDAVQLMAYVPQSLPAAIGSEEKLVTISSGSAVMMSTSASSQAAALTLTESGSNIVVTSSDIVPGMELKVCDGETGATLNTYTFSIAEYGFVVNKSIFNGKAYVVLSVEAGSAYGLPCSFNSAGKLIGINDFDKVFLFTADSGAGEYRASHSNNILKLENSSFGASISLNFYAVTGKTAQTKLNTKPYYYDYEDCCFYVPESLISAYDCVKVEAVSGFTAQFPDDEINTGSETIVMAGNYSGPYFQTKFRVHEDSEVASMTVSHTSTELLIKADSFSIAKELILSISGDDSGTYDYDSTRGGFVIPAADLNNNEYELRSREKTYWSVGNTAVTMHNGTSIFTMRFNKNSISDLENTIDVARVGDYFNVEINAVAGSNLNPSAGNMFKVTVAGTSTSLPDTYFATMTGNMFVIKIPASAVGNGDAVVVTPYEGITTIPLSSNSPISYNSVASNNPGETIAFTTNSESTLNLDFATASGKIKVTSDGMGRSNSIWLFTAEPQNYSSSSMFNNIIGSRHYYDLDGSCMYIDVSEIGSNKTVFVRYKTELTKQTFDDDFMSSKSLLYLNTSDYVVSPAGRNSNDYKIVKVKLAADSTVTEGVYVRSRGDNGFTVESNNFNNNVAIELLDENGEDIGYGYESQYDSNNGRFKIEFSTLSERGKYIIRTKSATSWTLEGSQYGSSPSITLNLDGSDKNIINAYHDRKTNLKLDLIDSGQNLMITTINPANTAAWKMSATSGDYHSSVMWSWASAYNLTLTIPVAQMGESTTIDPYTVSFDEGVEVTTSDVIKMS